MCNEIFAVRGRLVPSRGRYSGKIVASSTGLGCNCAAFTQMIRVLCCRDSREGSVSLRFSFTLPAINKQLYHNNQSESPTLAPLRWSGPPHIAIALHCELLLFIVLSPDHHGVIARLIKGTDTGPVTSIDLGKLAQDLLYVPLMLDSVLLSGLRSAANVVR